jgi:hypothetical protein
MARDRIAPTGATVEAAESGVAATLVRLYLALDATTGQYGFTTVASEASAAFATDSGSGLVGIDTTTTTGLSIARHATRGVLIY